jgi:hypothetical protein
MESDDPEDEADGYAYPGGHNDFATGTFPSAVGHKGRSGNEKETTDGANDEPDLTYAPRRFSRQGEQTGPEPHVRQGSTAMIDMCDSPGGLGMESVE